MKRGKNLSFIVFQAHCLIFCVLLEFDGFWQLFSEVSLVDAFVLSPRTVHLHIYFLREHMNEIPEAVLKVIDAISYVEWAHGLICQVGVS